MSADGDSLAGRLVAAEVGERPGLIVEGHPMALLAAVQMLAARRDDRGTASLAAIEALTTDKEVRKAARRELHRLGSAGIKVLDVDVPVVEVETHSHRLTDLAAWATNIDPLGVREVWIAGARSLGGAWVGIVLLSDVRGIIECEIVETSRRAVLKQIAANKEAGDATWVQIPPEYALQLIHEVVGLTPSAEPESLRSYARFVEMYGEADSAPSRPLAFERVSPVEARLHPEWLRDSDALLGERELGGWAAPVSDEMKARAINVARGGGSSPLLVGAGGGGANGARALLSDEIREVMAAPWRKRLSRRLEESAFLFLETDRLYQAQMAIAAVAALADESLNVLQHPLVGQLAVIGLAASVAREASGGVSFGPVLFNLLQPALGELMDVPISQTSRGLILPS